MKNLIILLGLLFSVSAASSQILVETTGIVDIGATLDHTARINRVAVAQVLGRTFPYNSGARLAFGDLGIAQFSGVNVFVGEFGTTDTDQLQLHGKLGQFFTVGGQGTDVAMSIEPSRIRMFKPLFVQGVQIFSDARLKTDVADLKGHEGLFKLNPVSFVYNFPKPPDVPAIPNDGSQPINEKEKASLEEKPVAEVLAAKKYGFIAQEVSKVYPDLVSEGSDGYLSVDYIGLIPLMVDGMQAQQGQINQLLQLNGLPASSTKSEDPLMLSQATASVKLPVTASYFLPEKITQASLVVYNMKGVKQKEYAILTGGSGKIELKPGEIPAGIYSCSIVCDGKISAPVLMVRTQ